MWKLIIKQKRKAEYSEGFVTDKVEFVGKDIEELALMVIRLSKFEVVETTYRFERVGDVNE